MVLLLVLLWSTCDQLVKISNSLWWFITPSHAASGLTATRFRWITSPLISGGRPTNGAGASWYRGTYAKTVREHMRLVDLGYKQEVRPFVSVIHSSEIYRCTGVGNALHFRPCNLTLILSVFMGISKGKHWNCLGPCLCVFGVSGSMEILQPLWHLLPDAICGCDPLPFHCVSLRTVWILLLCTLKLR